jgi:hypothetical protein
MTINFANPTPGPPPPPQPIGGTFTSTIDVAFDLRLGSLTGTIEASNTLTLDNNQPTLWSHYPAPTDLQITNVNSILNGTDHSNDFFILGVFKEKHPTQGQHVVLETGATIPEPSTIVTGVLGLIGGALLVRRCSRRRAA